MGLLDGDLRALFGAAFGGLYLDGTLHKDTTTFSGGTVTGGFTDVAVKVSRPTAVSQKAVQSGGNVATDVRMYVLQDGLVGVSPEYKPETDDEITVEGQRYLVMGVNEDPAGTHWPIWGRKKR